MNEKDVVVSKAGINAFLTAFTRKTIEDYTTVDLDTIFFQLAELNQILNSSS